MPSKIEFIRGLNIVKIYQDLWGGDVPRDGNIICPFHDDHAPSLHFYGDHFHCFSCGKTGSAIDLLLQLKYHGDREKTRDIINEICSRYGYVTEEAIPETTTVKSVFNKEAYEAKIKYSQALENFNKILVVCLNRIKDEDNVFLQRGITKEVIYSYGLGYVPSTLDFNTDKDLSPYKEAGLCAEDGTCLYKNRYMIPQRDAWGHIEGYLGRIGDPDSEAPKYKSTLNNAYYTGARSLFNWDRAKGFSQLYVVEGCFDALSIISMGLRNVVAIKGKELHDPQWEKMKDKEIYLCLDNDKAGKEGTYMIIKEHRDKRFKVCDLTNEEGYKDVNDIWIAEEEGLHDYLNNKIDGIEWAINYIKENFNEVDGWTELAVLIGSDDEAYREKFPMNVSYNPIEIKNYWKKFYEGE